MLNFSRATFAQSMASCCISSFMSACLITAFLSAVDISTQQNKNEPTDLQPTRLRKSKNFNPPPKQIPSFLKTKTLFLCRYFCDRISFRAIIFELYYFLMISIEQERRNRPTYIELKNAINIGEKERKLQKLGGSIKASIQKLRRLKTDILAENNIRRLGQMLAEYEKENLYYNQLQKSLVEIDEQSALLDRIKQMNKEFIDTHQPEELQKKLEFMKNQRKTNFNIDNSVAMASINEQQLSGQILASNSEQLRRKMLEEKQEELNQIEVLVTKINKIAKDTGAMILEQGMKLQIAATTMSRIKNNLKDGRQDLAQANEYQQDTNKKLMVFCLLVVVIVSVVVLILYSSSKKSQ